MEFVNQIHKYFLAIAIIAAFIHFVYNFFKSYQKLPIIEDLTIKEIKSKSFGKLNNLYSTTRNLIKPILIFMFWTFCIFLYTFLAIKLGFIW